MTVRDTSILALTYFFVFVLMIGLLCVVCSYATWFRPRSETAERKAFIDSINHGVTVSRPVSSESEWLLSGRRV